MRMSLSWDESVSVSVSMMFAAVVFVFILLLLYLHYVCIINSSTNQHTTSMISTYFRYKHQWSYIHNGRPPDFGPDFGRCSIGNKEVAKSL